MAQKDMQAFFNEYAIFATGGKQYQAIPGKTIQVEKLEGEDGATLTFDTMMLRKRGESIEIGQPYLPGKITASIVKQMRGPKLIAFRFQRRKKVRTKKGHRQSWTIIRIESI